MPTAQSSTTNKKVDNKIASAAAKVAEQSSKTTNQEAASTGASTTGIKTPQEQPEFIKQSLILIEKKVRNLEKRKVKLEEYKELQRKGTVLNEDQLAAVSRFDEVIRTLELARELEKQFIGLANDALKQQKKQAKKEQLEKEEYVKEKVKEIQKTISVLNTFGDETVRNDFLNETNGAAKLSELELNMLDAFNKLVEPSELNAQLDTSSAEVADYLLNLVEGKNKQIVGLITEPATTTPITFNDLKKIFDRILTSSYWTKEQEQPITAEVLQTEQQSEQIQDTQEQQQPIVDELSNLNINDKQNEQVNIPAPTETNQQTVFHQQNTSDSDFVIVNSNDYSNENTQSKLQQHSPSQQHHQQQQQQQTKAYFTTLNPTGNINEFLQNNDEGINFLQDSQIQQAKQLQQQQQQQQQENYEQQQQQTQEHQQFNNYNQDMNQNEAPKDQRGPRGPREYNGQRNFDQRRNNNFEQRRSGDGNRNYQNREYQPRNNDNYQPRNSDNYQPRGDNYNNVPRNGGGGGGSGYRGGNRGGSGGGGYRGGFTNTGPRTNSGGNNNYRAPRNQDSNHQQTVA